VARGSRPDFRIFEIRVDRSAPVPQHRQIYAALRDAILRGDLKADEALPSTRRLALDLGVSRNTVMSAYELLLAEGFVNGRGGAGTFVSRDAMRPEPPAPPPVIEPRQLSNVAELLRVWPPALTPTAHLFWPSLPALDAFPFSRWSRILGRIARDRAAPWVTERDPMGHLPLRRAIAERLAAIRSFRCDPAQVIIVTGSQLGLYMCSMLLLDPNDSVWMEDPGWPTARLTFLARTNRLVPVPVDDAGIDIEAGKRLSPNPRAIYVTPTHQWPLGRTMQVQRRLALLQFAAERGAWILEDDYDGDLRYDRKTYAALSGLDESARVIHLGTFSKTMHGGLRIGYIVVPPDLVESFVVGRQIMDRYPDTINQAGLTEFIESGAYAKHVYEMQSLYLERHELLSELISKQLAGFLVARRAETGTFTVTELFAGLDDVALARAIKREGFESLPLSQTYTGSAAMRGLLLGHAAARPEEIRRGVDAIERIASTWPPLARA
jgi:GntR family transcriptional regulator / MocR family aminotransferase